LVRELCKTASALVDNLKIIGINNMMNRLAKIADSVKTFPSVMSNLEEIKIMRLLEELSADEIIEGKEIFKKTLCDLADSHSDNYVMEHDVKTVVEYTNFIKWLEKIKMIIDKNFEEYIENIIGAMSVFNKKTDWCNQLEELFTHEELEYICISGVFPQNFCGKEYYVMECWHNNERILVDNDKMVYKEYKQQNEFRIIPRNIKLIEYLDKK
jgi:hypothetical protein